MFFIDHKILCCKVDMFYVLNGIGTRDTGSPCEFL